MTKDNDNSSAVSTEADPASVAYSSTPPVEPIPTLKITMKKKSKTSKKGTKANS
jgi:hypothetical protein